MHATDVHSSYTEMQVWKINTTLKILSKLENLKIVNSKGTRTVFDMLKYVIPID